MGIIVVHPVGIITEAPRMVKEDRKKGCLESVAEGKRQKRQKDIRKGPRPRSRRLENSMGRIKRQGSWSLSFAQVVIGARRVT